MGAFPLDQTLPAGTLVSVPISYYSLTYVTRLSESDIVTACADTGNFSASSFTYDISTSLNAVGQSGRLYGTISADDDVGDIIQQIKAAINQFHTVVGLNVSEIDSTASTNAPSFWDSFKGIGTTIQTDVFIVLLIVLAAIYFISKSKNIRIGV